MEMNIDVCKRMEQGILEQTVVQTADDPLQLIPDHIIDEIERLEQENAADVESIDSLLKYAPKVDQDVLESLMAEVGDDFFKYSDDELITTLLDYENLLKTLDFGIEESRRNVSEYTAVECCSQQTEMNNNIQKPLVGQVNGLQTQETLQQQRNTNLKLHEDLNQFEAIQRKLLEEIGQQKQLQESTINKGVQVCSQLDKGRNSVPISHCGLSNRERPMRNQVFSNEKIHQQQELNSELQRQFKRVKAIPMNYPQLMGIVHDIQLKHLQVEKESTIDDGKLTDSQYHSRYPTMNRAVTNNSVPLSDSCGSGREGLTHNKRPFNEISQQEADPGDRSNVSQSKRFCVISPDAQWQCHVVDTTNLRPSSRFLEDNSPQSNKESQVRLDHEKKDDNRNVEDCLEEEDNNTVTGSDEGDKIATDRISDKLNTFALHDGVDNCDSLVIKTKRLKVYVCDECNRSFKRKEHLAQHLRIHTGEKPYSCNECNRSFRQKNDLSRHLRIHSGEKPYRCNVCNTLFRIKSHLTVHSRLHTGEKPFSCNICYKSFNQTNQLSYHLKLHTGEKPFHCNECKKSFIQKCHLSRHLKLHASEKTRISKLCKKSLRVKQNISTQTGNNQM